jgi:hypothetical protein
MKVRCKHPTSLHGRGSDGSSLVGYVGGRCCDRLPATMSVRCLARGVFLPSFALALLLPVFFGVAVADATAAPSIESESASHITSSDAMLEAELNPHEAEPGVYYQFQLVAQPSEYPDEILCPPKLPPGSDGCVGTQSASALPIGFIATGSEGQLVSLDLTGEGIVLQPATTYHYRALAAKAVQTEDTIEWKTPIVLGVDQTFTTPPEPPLIMSEATSNLTPSDATLEAVINPRGSETSYHFEIAKSPPACLPAPPPFMPCAHIEIGNLPTSSLSASTEPQLVKLDLNSVGTALEAGTTYRFRVVASNAGGKAEGSVTALTTLATSCATNQVLCPSSSKDGAGAKTVPYKLCMAKARKAFRLARRALNHKRGAAHAQTIKRANRRKHRVMSTCRAQYERRQGNI